MVDPSAVLVVSRIGQLSLYEQALILAAIALGSIICYCILYLAMKLAAKKTEWKFDDELVHYCKYPLLFLCPTVAVRITWSHTSFIINEGLNNFVLHSLTIAIILQSTWIVVNIIRVGFSTLERTHQWKDDTDNTKVRELATQLSVVKRLVYVIVFFLMSSAIVLTFPGAWELGVSMLASAGAAGLILGLSAKPGLENIVCAVVIAFTQPITLDDQIIVDGEFGRVEEIKSQYVVVRTWDGRRVIHPLSDFTSKKFENWSKTSLEKTGTIILYFDASILTYMDALRERFTHILQFTDPSKRLWDGRVSNLSVADVKDDGTIEIRVVVSGRNPGNVSDLKSAVREQLMTFVVRTWPDALVRRRGEVRVFNDQVDHWAKGSSNATLQPSRSQNIEKVSGSLEKV